ncbi:hypothetical protein D3C76_1675390 [compost metagenome]
MIAQLCGPAIITFVDGGTHQLEHRIGAAHGLDVVLSRFNGGQWVEVGRIAVVEAQVALIHRA